MASLKHVALQIGFHAGFFRLLQFARRRQAAILTFHRFWSDGEGDPRGVPIQRFAECMEYLVRHHRVVSLPDLTGELRRGVVRSNSVAVTLDDGYHEAFSLAAPVLRRYGIPASVFVVSDFVDGRLWLWTDRFRFVFERAPQGTTAFKHRGATHLLEIRDENDRWRAEERWREYVKTIPVAEQGELLEAIAEAWGIEIPASPPYEYRPMTWVQLRALAAEGFEVGAHTRTHPILSRVAPEQLQDEIVGCKEQIERHLGVSVRHFAYPNGRRQDYTSEAVETAARAGYEAAVTAVAGGNTPGIPIFELRRFVPDVQDLAHFAECVSGFELLRERLYKTVGLSGRSLG